MLMVTRTCEHCAGEFSLAASAAARPGRGRFCSLRCSAIVARALVPDQVSTAVARVCAHCAACFLAAPGNIKRGKAKYCSKRCAAGAKRGARQNSAEDERFIALWNEGHPTLRMAELMGWAAYPSRGLCKVASRTRSLGLRRPHIHSAEAIAARAAVAERKAAERVRAPKAPKPPVSKPRVVRPVAVHAPPRQAPVPTDAFPAAAMIRGTPGTWGVPVSMRWDAIVALALHEAHEITSYSGIPAYNRRRVARGLPPLAVWLTRAAA